MVAFFSASDPAQIGGEIWQVRVSQQLMSCVICLNFKIDCIFGNLNKTVIRLKIRL